MKKYRFKTKEEFIRDGEWDHKDAVPNGWNYEGRMNHFLGQDIPEKYNEMCDRRDSFFNDDWHFASTNYVLKETKRVNTYTDFVFIPGNIYVGEWDGRRVIFKPTTPCLDDPCYVIKSTDEFKLSKYGCCSSNGVSFREANQEEKDWLEACIKANATVPRPSNSIPVAEQKMFKKGDYIVYLSKGTCLLLQNYCYKQSQDENYLRVEKDASGLNNFWPSLGRYEESHNWRYATPEEIAEYNRLDKPYDVRTISNKVSFKQGDYIVITECNHKGHNGKLNHCYKLITDDFYIGDISRIPLDEPQSKKARLATPEEIAEYDRLGKPYDVTTLVKEKPQEQTSFPQSEKVEESKPSLDGYPVKKETLIEDVHSVSVMLSTKNKSKQFKF